MQMHKLYYTITHSLKLLIHINRGVVEGIKQWGFSQGTKRKRNFYEKGNGYFSYAPKKTSLCVVADIYQEFNYGYRVTKLTELKTNYCLVTVR